MRKTIKRIIGIFSVMSLVFSGCVMIAWENGRPCVSGTGPPVTQERQLASFQSISLESRGILYLSQGTETSFKVEAPENLWPHILTSVSGETLTIDQEECFRGSPVIKYYITMQEVRALRVEGSGDVIGETPIQGQAIEIAIHGSGNIKLETHTTRLESSILGSGDMILTGRSDELEINIQGSGDTAAGQLEASKVYIRIAGSGDASVKVIDEISVTISGSGDVVYSGRPVLGEISIQGSGDITKSD